MPTNRPPQPPLTAPTATPTGLASEGTEVQHTPPTHLLQPDGLPAVPGFAVSREVARGGMGVVYAAYDPTFEREVAVKVMHNGQDAGRFVVESKVTAKLPHPGIPPVYTLGTLSDGRPFLAMKLIEGHTLADELKAANRSDLLQLLDAFARICQTVGFAHSRGIIHRDLKPSNVMVGAFGEVLVMDWGLAKQVGGDDTHPLAALQGGARDGETLAGQVKGTPAYMAPEQARGEPVDACTDVFALGGILAVMLSGKPPFLGETVLDTVLKAAQAEMEDCFSLLDACGADAELIDIAKKCLAANAADRYANGEEVAAAVVAYHAGVEERLQQAERDRAAAEAKAAEQRKRRIVQLALAASVLLLLAAGGAFAWYSDRQAEQAKRKQAEFNAMQAHDEAERKALEAVAAERERIAKEQARKGIAANLKLAADLRQQHKFKLADAALVEAAALAKGSVPELLSQVEQARADLAFVVQLDDIRFGKWVWITEPGRNGFNTNFAPPEYYKAFAARGLPLDTLDVVEAAKQIAASSVKAELIAAVDDWALHEPKQAIRERLLDIARRADPGAWTDRLRDPAVRRDKAALVKLAADADPATVSPSMLSTLAGLMERQGLNPAPLLAAARAKHPTSFELAFALANWHAIKSTTGQEIGPYEAARALRPENVTAWYNLGVALQEKGDRDGAIAAYKEAIRLNPKLAHAHTNLGNLLGRKGDLDGEIAAHKEAIKTDPTYRLAYFNLGVALQAKRDLEGAIAAYKAAIRLDPEYARAYINLGDSLRAKGNGDSAIAVYRQAITLNPTDAVAHNNMGTALKAKGDLDGAIAAYKQAVQHGGKAAAPCSNLGAIYFGRQQYTEAEACARDAIKADPTYAYAHGLLGYALQESGDIPGARAAFTQAARLDKRWAAVLAQLPPLTLAPPPREK